MKRSALAAVIAVLTLASGAVFAEAVAFRVSILDYRGTDGVLTGLTLDKRIETVRVLPATDYVLVDNPDLIVDPTCRNLANTWNMGRFQTQDGAYFQKLLGQASDCGCNVAYVRTDTVDTSGAYGLVSVRLSP